MSDHRRFKILAATALDFGLSPVEAGELALHRASCPECRRLQLALASDTDEAQRMPRAHAPDHIRDAVIAAATRRQPALNPSFVLQIVGVAAVVVALVLAGLVWIGSRPIEGPGQFRSWARLTDTSVFGGGSVASVVAQGSGLVAVGSVSTDGRYVGAVWTSTNGSTWSRVPSQPALTDTMLAQVVAHGSALVMMSLDCLPGGAYCGGPRFWLSTSGTVWSEAPMDSSGTCGCGSYNKVIATETGFLAVGSTKLTEDTTPSDAAVAISRDGSSWTEEPTSLALRGASMASAASNQSVIVAVGAAGPDTPAAWFSPDGRTWTRLPASSVPATGRFRDVELAGSRFVAVGYDGSNAAVWTSLDGRSWEKEQPSPALENAEMWRIVPTQAGMFVLGASSDGTGLAWFSVDGSSWTRLDTGDIFRGANMLAAGAIGSRAVLFGAGERGAIVALSDR